MINLISLEKLNKLHPAVRTSAIECYNRAVKVTPPGVHPIVTQTFRSFEESDSIYQQGRTTPGIIVSYAQAGQSYHNYYLALDFVITVGGKFLWKIDDNWLTVVRIFREGGWECGIDWKGKKRDPPHFQKTTFNGKTYNWRELLALHNAGKVDREGYIILP